MFLQFQEGEQVYFDIEKEERKMAILMIRIILGDDNSLQKKNQLNLFINQQEFHFGKRKMKIIIML